MEKLSTTLDEYRNILEKLFPTVAPETLINLPREKLVELMGKGSSPVHVQVPPPHNPASPATSASVDAHVSPISNEDGNLESLQTMPDDSDARNLGAAENGISDDVNALSLSARQASSYLGVSSINAVLKVIVWLDPGCLGYFSRTPAVNRQESAMDYPPPPPLSDTQTWGSSQAQPETPQPQLQVSDQQLLDAYFTYFHPFAPMLDEQCFRETYISGRRRDDRWLGLLNIVFALGSIATGTADDVSHKTYYVRCKRYVSLESLGSSHVETIQTLGLLGGYYLHYISQPNLAYTLMGAALRMAAALGFHKEFSDSPEGPNKQNVSSADLKRRVWWSLFCMDTWGGMTLGRPSMGRFGPTITVKLPHCRESVCSLIWIVFGFELTPAGKRS